MKKSTLTEALGKARPRHTFTNDKGDTLTITLYPVSLLEVAEFEEWQEQEGKSTREMLKMLIQLIQDRDPDRDEAGVKAFLRRVPGTDMNTYLTTMLSGQAPDPNA